MQTTESYGRNNLWVFRDGRRTAPATLLYLELERALQELLRGPASQSRIIAGLLRAGELESALGDAGMPESDSIERVTEALAQVLCGDGSSLLTVANLARGLQAPDQSVLAFSPAEGFAYYALHPLDFSQLPQPILADSRPAAVIGIRSIGTTLSAIVTAALRQRSRKPAARRTYSCG